MVTFAEALMLIEAVASTAIENDWDEEKQKEVFKEALLKMALREDKNG